MQRYEIENRGATSVRRGARTTCARPTEGFRSARGRCNLALVGARLLGGFLAAGGVLAGCSDRSGRSLDAGTDAAPSQPVRRAVDELGDAGEPTVRNPSDVGAVAAGQPVRADAGVSDAGHDADGDGSGVSLVIHELWKLLEPAEDPFDDRPPTAHCTRAGVMAETLADERALGVDTGLCNYLTVSQPTLEDVAAGQTIKVRLWHFALTAPEPAEAHAALVVDGVELLNERLPIPAPGGLTVKEVRATRAIPAGSVAFFHLHNHGMNSWALVELSVRR